jgi:hypothetical protein
VVGGTLKARAQVLLQGLIGNTRKINEESEIDEIDEIDEMNERR